MVKATYQGKREWKSGAVPRLKRWEAAMLALAVCGSLMMLGAISAGAGALLAVLTAP